MVHGVAISPDGRYAFVTAEGIGTEPGSLDIIDPRAVARDERADLDATRRPPPENTRRLSKHDTAFGDPALNLSFEIGVSAGFESLRSDPRVGTTISDAYATRQ